MKLEEFKNKKILVVGAGVEGMAIFKYFKVHLSQNTIKLVDQKDGENYLDCQKDFDIAIKSPGVKKDVLEIPYTTLTNIFLSNAKGTVIGVTGTKGKSTTSALTYLMLKKQGLDVHLGGNIGQPSIDFLDLLTDDSWVVLEMSSFQLADLKISPHIAVMLMIAREHNDYHRTMEEYVNAKRNIVRFQKPGDFAIFNRDYPATNESDIYTAGKIFKISREKSCDNGCYIQDRVVWLSKNHNPLQIMKTSEIKLLGEHNFENVCGSAMAASLAGVSRKNIAEVLETFKGLEHRLEFTGEASDVKYYNDSLATIPEAAIEALEALPKTETLIAGGFDRGLDFSDLGKKIVSSKVKTLILFPTTGGKIWQAVSNASKTNLPEKFEVNSMEQAVKIASAETLPGAVCLMSPASASFGLFKNYKDRGEQFKNEVRKLIAN